MGEQAAGGFEGLGFGGLGFRGNEPGCKIGFRGSWLRGLAFGGLWFGGLGFRVHRFRVI